MRRESRAPGPRARSGRGCRGAGLRAAAASGGQGVCALGLGLEWGFGCWPGAGGPRGWANRPVCSWAGGVRDRSAGQGEGLDWAAAPVGPSRPPAREWARSRGARLGWFSYLGQMPLFFFLCLLFLFFFLFLSYSMPWVSHIGIHVLPTCIPPSVVL